MSFIAQALLNLYPDGQFIMKGDHMSAFEWVVLPSKPISTEEIDLEVYRLVQESMQNQYKQLRAKEYPPLEDLADALYWQSQGDNTLLDIYMEKCAEVKAKYPKIAVEEPMPADVPSDPPAPVPEEDPNYVPPGDLND
jgi:hypothetical protein